MEARGRMACAVGGAPQPDANLVSRNKLGFRGRPADVTASSKICIDQFPAKLVDSAPVPLDAQISARRIC